MKFPSPFLQCTTSIVANTPLPVCAHVYNAAGMTYELLEFFQLAYPQLRYSYSGLNINAFSVAIEAD